MNCDEIHQLLNSGDLCQETERGLRLLTDCLHPSFEQAAVYVVRMGNGFIVTDGGDAASVTLRHGRDDAAIQTCLKQASIRFSVELDDGVLKARAPNADWLKSAILAVANASAMASSNAVAVVIAKQDQALRAAIRFEIAKVVPEHRISSDFEYRGGSGRVWHVDFAVIGDRGPMLIKAVTPHPNSISAGYTAFGDIGVNDNIPRFAVYDRPPSAENQALIRQVAQLMPLSSVENGLRQALSRQAVRGS